MKPTSFSSVLDEASSQYLAESWGRRSRVLRVSDLQTLRGIASTAIGILCSGGFCEPFIRLTSNGRNFDQSEFMMDNRAGGVAYRAADFRRVNELMESEGATLILLGLETLVDEAGAIARSISESTQLPVDINLYLTPPGGRGFERHFDPQEVLLLQISGSKVWELWEPSQKPEVGEYFPVPNEAGPPDLEVELVRGQALHIPRGWIHRGQGGHEVSGHLTIGATPGVSDWEKRLAGEPIGLAGLEDRLNGAA